MDRPKPPRPSAPAANERLRLAAEQQQGSRLAELEARVGRDEDALNDFREAVKRRDVDQTDYMKALGAGMLILARELGVEERMPRVLRDSVRPPPPAANENGEIEVVVEEEPRPLPTLAKSAADDAQEARNGTYLAIALVLLELLLNAIRNGGH